ncbi:amino acid-binding protein [Ligilactobacillus ruminis]|uniref:Amino acid-binding protein n=1 Tax=Ligilactobacillus ruminis TaxID=1623 RepID=A0A8B2Z0L5_9LACO|nr:amino acid-binding protein [Ligilactobacillus ruminis]
MTNSVTVSTTLLKIFLLASFHPIEPVPIKRASISAHSLTSIKNNVIVAYWDDIFKFRMKMDVNAVHLAKHVEKRQLVFIRQSVQNMVFRHEINQ